MVHNLTAEAINTSSIRVSWDAPSTGNYDGFIIMVDGRMDSVDNSTSKVELVGLEPGSLYDVTVQSRWRDVVSADAVVKGVPTCKLNIFYLHFFIFIQFYLQ